METKKPKNNPFVAVILIGILLMASVIRFWQLTNIPISLYWDEMDVGYQAFSFVKTGADYYGNFLPLHFHSFADFRTPLYIYTTVPFIALLGLTALAVRLPAAIFGVISIWLLFQVTVDLTKSKRTGIFAALFLAIVPWHIQYSRMAFEVTLMLSCFLFGLHAFFKSMARPRWFIWSIVGFLLAAWTYSTAKIFVPVTGLILTWLYWRQLWSLPRKYLVVSLIVGCVLGLPLIYSSLLQHGGQWFSEISIFTDPTGDPEIAAIRKESYTSRDNFFLIPTKTLDDIAYNKTTRRLNTFVTNYFSAYSPQFLFLTGDPNLRHSPAVDTIGQLYWIGFIGIVLGLIALALRSRLYGQQTVWFLYLWLVLAPLPSAITREGATHATRLFFLLPALIIFWAIGADFVWQSFKRAYRYIILGICAVILTFEWFSYSLYYFTNYRLASAPAFEYDISQAVEYAIAHKQTYPQIIIDSHKNWAVMAYLFKQQYDPKQFQTQRRYQKHDILPGVDSISLDNVNFPGPGERNWAELVKQNSLGSRTLLLIANDAPSRAELEKSSEFVPLGIITVASGLPAYEIFDYLDGQSTPSNQ